MGGAVIGPSGRYELGAEVVTIGRAPTNKIVVSDSLASGRHAEIRPEGAGYVLVDLGSTNGTSLNGQRLPAQIPQTVRGGDVITIGSVQLSVELAAQGPAYAPTERVGAPPAQGPAYAPTERAGAPPAQPDYAAPAYVPPPPPGYPSAPDPFAPPPPPPLPDNFSQYGGGQGVATSYYSEPPPPPPPLPYVPPPAYGPPGINLGGPSVGAPATYRRRLPLIIGGILAAVIVVAVIVVLVGGQGPESVVKSYYTSLQNHNYTAAYGLFDTRLQGVASEPRYEQFFTCLDAMFGAISSFSTSQTSKSDTQASVQATITRSKIPSYTEVVALVQVNGKWEMDSVNGIPQAPC